MQSKKIKHLGERNLIVVRTMTINDGNNIGNKTKVRHVEIRKTNVYELGIKRNNEKKKLTLFRPWV